MVIEIAPAAEKNKHVVFPSEKLNIFGYTTKNHCLWCLGKKQTDVLTYAKCCIDQDDTTRPWGKQSFEEPSHR